MCETWTLHEQREYAWEYFKVHAQQRMSLFNFFVVFSSLATTGLVTTLQDKAQAHLVGIALGVLLVLISFVFSKLDQRVAFLIKHAESAVKLIESKFSHEDSEGESPFALVTAEEAFTQERRNRARYWPWQRHLTYSNCFQLAFWTFGVIGTAGMLLSLGLWIARLGQSSLTLSNIITIIK